MLGISGSTGSFVYYVPEWDLIYAGTFNQFGWMKKHLVFLLQIHGILHRIET
jgi:hypothetical protein